MLIKCPKCQVTYELADDLVPQSGLKMRCNSCGEVFKAYPEDAVKEPLTEKQKKQNVLKMFERFSQTTDNIFSPESDLPQPVPAKVRIVHLTHYKNTINYILLILVILVMLALLYLMRFDVVRYVPKAESLYQKFGIESVYAGTNLQFINIKTEEFIDQNVSKIKITGVIDNPSSYQMKVLPVLVSIYDENGQKLLEERTILPQKRTFPNYKLPFELVVVNPIPLQKNIHITFAD